MGFQWTRGIRSRSRRAENYCSIPMPLLPLPPPPLPSATTSRVPLLGPPVWRAGRSGTSVGATGGWRRPGERERGRGPSRRSRRPNAGTRCLFPPLARDVCHLRGAYGQTMTSFLEPGGNPYSTLSNQGLSGASCQRSSWPLTLGWVTLEGS